MPLRLVALQFSQPNQRPLDPDKGTRASKDETIQKRKTERGGSVVHFSGPNNSRPDCSQKQLQLLPHYHPYYYSTRAWARSRWRGVRVRPSQKRPRDVTTLQRGEQEDRVVRDGEEMQCNAAGVGGTCNYGQRNTAALVSAPFGGTLIAMLRSTFRPLLAEAPRAIRTNPGLQRYQRDFAARLLPGASRGSRGTLGGIGLAEMARRVRCSS